MLIKNLGSQWNKRINKIFNSSKPNDKEIKDKEVMLKLRDLNGQIIKASLKLEEQRIKKQN